MTFKDLQKEYNSTIDDYCEIATIFEPIIEDGRVIGVVQKFKCLDCNEWEIEQIFTACMCENLEDFVYDNGFRDEERGCF